MNLRAEQGDAAAQFNLGLMNLRGEGSPPGLVEARRLFRLAAEQGHEDAQLFTGGSNSSGNSKVYYYCYYCLPALKKTSNSTSNSKRR